MNEEQKAIVKRLGIVAAVLAIVVGLVYFVYSPKDQSVVANPGTPYGTTTKSIAAIFRSGTWAVDSNGNGRYDLPADTTMALGKPGDIPLAGTWELAGGPSFGVFNNGVFTLFIGQAPQIFNFGGPGDIPVVGDWNGDGRTKIGVFRKGFWLLDYNGNGKWDGAPLDRQIAMGGTLGELPIVGDWNGDGKSDLGLFRPDASFALDINGNGQWDKEDKVFFLGQPGDKAIVGDWNGDGRSKVGVYRNGFWSLDYNGNQRWDGVATDRFVALGGSPGDVPIIGDWNGDGRTKVGVYRQTQWVLDSDGNGVYDKNDKGWVFGLPGDVPVPLTPLRSRK